MTTFKVGDKVEVLNADKIFGSADKGIKTSDVVTVTEIDEWGDPVINELTLYKEELKHIRKIEPTKPTKNQRISALEKEVAELKKVVEELKPAIVSVELEGFENVHQSVQSVQNQTIEFEGGTYRKVERRAQAGDVVVFSNLTSAYTDNGKPYKVQDSDNNLTYTANSGGTYKVYGWGSSYPLPEVYELVEHPQSNNQKRAAIIEKAKRFVEECKNFTGGVTKRKGYRYSSTGYIVCDSEFVVNREKNAVVALLKRQMHGSLVVKGIAKCHPHDVFNEHIGKAIALGRALGLDVSEFEQAVQPDEVVVGMLVRVTGNTLDTRIISNVEKIDIKTNTLEYAQRNGATILNDSQAKY